MKNITIVILILIIYTNLVLAVIVESNDLNDVYKIQKKLLELGYDPGSYDGIWGKKTSSAIKNFQQDNGLPVTGTLDERSKEKLFFNNEKFSGAWNFGPNINDCKPVEWVVEKMISVSGKNIDWVLDKKSNPHEANTLILDNNKSKKFKDLLKEAKGKQLVNQKLTKENKKIKTKFVSYGLV